MLVLASRISAQEVNWENASDTEIGMEQVWQRSGLLVRRPESWYASVDFNPLQAEPGADVLIARSPPVVTSTTTTTTTTGTPPNQTTVTAVTRTFALGPAVFDSGRPKGEFDFGGRFVVGRTFADGFQAEVAYQGNYAWHGFATAEDPSGNLSFLFSNFAFDTATGITADQGTFVEGATSFSMTTAEANLRMWVEMPPGPLDIQLLFGGRYFNGSNTFRVRTVGTTTTDYLVATDNDLYGVQLGFNAKWLSTPTAYLDFEAKSALCTNFASQITTSSTLPAGLSANDHRTAFVSEFLGTVNLQLRPNVTFRAGYQVILANGLALAAQNMPTTSTPTAPATLIDNGNMVYHGPTIGLIWKR